MDLSQKEFLHGNLTSNLILGNIFFFYSPKRQDKYAQDAIDLLSNSGIKFEKHARMGINPLVFAEYMISSGIEKNYFLKSQAWLLMMT
jgi:hypothetical protein